MRKNQVGEAKVQGCVGWDLQGKEGVFYRVSYKGRRFCPCISASVETQGSEVWLAVLSNQTLFILIVLLVFQV